MKKDITIAITSCGRFDLLKKTINSIEQSVNLSLYQKIMTEDSRDEKHIAKIKEANKNGFLKGWKILYTGGSGYSNPFQSHKAALNCMYNKISTEYTFHCEDDWYFRKTDYDYIFLSKNILEKNKTIGIVMMTNFFALNEKNIGISRDKIRKIFFDNITYTFFGHKFIKMKDYSEKSNLYSLNPGLRRTDETKICLTNIGEKIDEELMGRKFKELQLISINFNPPICKHIGGFVFSTRFLKDGFFRSIVRVIKNGFNHYYTLFFK